MIVVHTDAGFIGDVEAMRTYLLQDLNVRNVRFTSDVRDVAYLFTVALALILGVDMFIIGQGVRQVSFGAGQRGGGQEAQAEHEYLRHRTVTAHPRASGRWNLASLCLSLHSEWKAMDIYLCSVAVGRCI